MLIKFAQVQIIKIYKRREKHTMKTRKIVLSLLVCLVMVAALCVGVACNKEVKLDLRDASQWGPGVAEGEDDIYVASNDKDGNLVFVFHKNDTYNCTRIMFASFDVADLQKVKTLVVTAKMTTDAPYPALLFKVEGTDDNFDGGNVEVKVKATEAYTTYEWDFGGYDLTKVTRFLIFADPGVAGSSGTITISEMYLTDKEVNSANDATKMPAEEGVTPDPIWGEVTADNPSIGNWVDGTPNNVYTVTKNADGSYKVDVHKKIGAGQWDALISYVYGDALASMKTFKLVVKGTAGKQILVKPFDNFEKRVTLTGEEQEIIIDVASFTADTSKDYSQKAAPTAENKVVVIGLPDVNTGNDTFTIISAAFSAEESGIVDTDIVNEITAENRTANGAWYDSGDNVYTIAQDGTAFDVTFDKATFEWSTMRAYVKGAAIANMKTLRLTVSGTEGQQILVKPFNAVEQWHTFTGGEDVVVVDLTKVADVNFEDKQPIFIFAAPGTPSATGSFRIINMEFSTEEADAPDVPVIQANQYYGDLNMSFNNYWRDAGDNHWTATEADGIWTLAYPANNSWSSIVTEIDLGAVEMNYVILEVKGTKDTTAIFNLGGPEVKFENDKLLSGDWETIALHYDNALKGNVTIRIFGGFNDGAGAGEIQIRRAQLYNVAKVAGEGNLDVNGTWVNAVKGSTRNAISFEGGVTTISYNAASWDSVLAWYDLGEGGFDKITIKIKGQAGHAAIVSINGAETKFENDSVFTGAEQTIEVDVSGLRGIVFIRMFFDFNDLAGAESGSVQITEAVFHKAA